MISSSHAAPAVAQDRGLAHGPRSAAPLAGYFPSPFSPAPGDDASPRRCETSHDTRAASGAAWGDAAVNRTGAA